MENKRRKRLLTEKKYNSKYWPGAENVVFSDKEEEESTGNETQ